MYKNTAINDYNKHSKPIIENLSFNLVYKFIKFLLKII